MKIVEKHEKHMVKFCDLNGGDLFRYENVFGTKVGMKLQEEVVHHYPTCAITCNMVVVCGENASRAAWMNPMEKVELIDAELHIL